MLAQDFAVLFEKYVRDRPVRGGRVRAVGQVTALAT